MNKIKRKRNNYSIYDIVLPHDIADMIDSKLGTEKKLDTYRICAYVIFRIGIDGKLHEISSKYIRSLIPGYRKYLDRLIIENIITTDNKYLCSISNDWSGDSKCKSYRLNSTFSSFRTIKVCYPKIIDALEGSSSLNSECQEDSKVTKIAHRNLKRFQIDLESAITYLCERQRGQIKGKEPLETQDAIAAFVGIMRIRNGFHYAKSCNYGRIHTNYTCLDSNIKMRCVFHISGKSLIHIDIQNSQASILRAVLLKQLDMNDPKIKAEMEMYTQFCKADLYEVLYLTSFAVDNIDSYNNEETAKEFENLFKQELDQKLMRKTAKQEIIKMLFDKKSQGRKKGKNLELYKKFKKIFPRIYEEIKKIKENQYQHLAHELQRFESRQILHPLIKFLNKEKIDFISIHDSVIILKEYKEIVINEFNRILINCNVETELKVEELYNRNII